MAWCSKNTLAFGPKANYHLVSMRTEKGTQANSLYRADRRSPISNTTGDTWSGDIQREYVEPSRTSLMFIFAWSTLFFWWFLIFFKMISLWKSLSICSLQLHTVKLTKSFTSWPTHTRTTATNPPLQQQQQQQHDGCRNERFSATFFLVPAADTSRLLTASFSRIVHLMTQLKWFS